MESAYGAKVIQSMLDTDYYTFTMMQAALHQYPNIEVEYDMIVRSAESLLPYMQQIREEVDKLCHMRFRKDELDFLGNPIAREYIKPDFLRFLELFQFDLKCVSIRAQDDQLAIKVRGPWLHCIMFEQPVLAMVSEIRNRNVYPDASLESVREQLYKKFDWLKANATEEELKLLMVTDFGTRRRLSFKAHMEVVDVMAHDFPGVFKGTSNVHIAHELGLPVIGTMAHQWLMAFQQFGRLSESQDMALESWVQEYRGRLGIALTDCISTDFFLSRFDLYFAKLFDGVRHDSGDPLVWAEKVIAHYKKLGIDPMTKVLVFSDGLDFPKCLKIIRSLKGRCLFEFGMGTNLACNVEGINPLSIVMKLVRVNGHPVIKFSDDPIKLVCVDDEFTRYASNIFKIDYKNIQKGAA